MKHILRRFLVWRLVIIFLMAVQPVYSRDTSEAVAFNPAHSGRVSEEGIVRVNLPIDLIRSQAKAALEKSNANPEAYIKEITRFDLDPMQDLLVVSGSALLPADIVYDMNDIAGGGDFPIEHRFSLSVKFPSARKLAVTGYFSLEIVEFKIDGQSYLNSLNRLSQYLVGLLANTSFMDWVLQVEPEKVGRSDNLSVQIKDLITSKGLRFRDRSVSFKLDLSKIEALNSYQSLEGLRVWNISPVLLKGSNTVALQIEAGLGKPARAWFDAVVARGESEEQTLAEVRSDLYEQFGNQQALISELDDYRALVKEQLNIPLWLEREERSYREIKSHYEAKVRQALDRKNPLFKADPAMARDEAKNEIKAFILNSMTQLKLKVQTMASIKGGGEVQKRSLPFLTKRLSQNALSQGVRFVRDFEFENEQMFPELEVVIAPHIPGVILRGVMNMDINVFMEMGLEGEGIQWSASPWRAAEDVWGAGIPFEVALRMHAFDGGVLGLDVESFSILSGSEKTTLSKASGHGNVMATWTKMAIVETLTTMAIEDPLAVTVTEDDVELKEEPYQYTLNKISEQSRLYQKELARMLEGDLAALVKLAEIDIEKNPFNMAGNQQAANNLRYLFQDILRYDESSETIQFMLDPKLVSEKLMASENTIEVWNMEALYDSLFNQTFIEVSVGDGKRSQSFVEKLFQRREFLESQRFVGIDETRKQVESDLIVSSDLKNFENFLNRLFSEASREQMKAVSRQLRENKEQSHYVMRDLNIKAIADGQLELSASLSLFERTKKGILGQIFSRDDWRTTQKDVLVKTRLKLSVEKLERYKNLIKLSPNEVFFGDEVIRIDLAEAGLRIEGDTSTLDKMVNLLASNINFESGLSQKVKRVVLNFLHRYLNDQDPKRNGNTTLAGVHLNKYAKILAHDDEILIQLNPHIMGVAFDVRLLPNESFSGRSVGLLVNKSSNTIEFHFNTSGNLAAVDKGELLRIMVKTKELFRPFLSDDGQSFEDSAALVKLYDQVLYNSDYSKLSLYHRLKRVMKNYQGVSDIIKPDTRVVDQINRNLGTQFGVSSGVGNNMRLTGSGVEIMYILSSALLMKEQMERFVERAKEIGVTNQLSFIGPMSGKINEINTRMIEPLMSFYEQEFKERNQKIINKGVTDWNHSYYPDALYCEGVYKLVKKWGQKSGR